MEYVISVYFKSRQLKLKAEQVYKSEQLERYKITGKNRSIMLQNDYPLVQRNSINKKKARWKLIAGEIYNPDLLQSIIRELEYLRKTI